VQWRKKEGTGKKGKETYEKNYDNGEQCIKISDEVNFKYVRELKKS
jgi:hypothetical protein